MSVPCIRGGKVWRDDRGEKKDLFFRHIGKRKKKKKEAFSALQEIRGLAKGKGKCVSYWKKKKRKKKKKGSLLENGVGR